LGFGWIAGALVFVALSGLAIWLLPFSVSAQMSVLAHTALGFVIVVPMAIWQLEHWLATRKAPWRFRKFCAYTGFWSLAVTTLAGLIISWQAVCLLAMSHFWDQVHLWSGLLSLPFIAYHVWPHQKKSTNGEGALPSAAVPVTKPDFSAARRRMWTVAAGTAIVLLASMIVAAVAYRGPDYHHYKLAATYNWAFGKNPFAPSLATTEDGAPVAPLRRATARVATTPFPCSPATKARAPAFPHQGSRRATRA
jgi:hypothetical protein